MGDVLYHIHHVLRQAHVHARLRGTKAVVIGILLVSALIVGEEEELVLHDRTAQCDASIIFLLLLVGSGITRTILQGIFATDKLLVVAKSVDAAMELVGTTLGDGVDGTTRETTLPYVERSHVHLYLLNGLHGNRFRTCLAAIRTTGSKAKHVVVGGTVYHERVVAVIGTGKRHHAAVGRGQLRIESHDVRDAMAYTWHVLYLLRRKAHGRTCLGGIQARAARHHHFLQQLLIRLQRAREVLGLTQTKAYIVKCLGLVSHVSDFHLVGSTRSHTLNSVTTIHVSDSVIHRTRGLVSGGNSRAYHVFPLGSHLTTYAGSGNLRHGH